MFLLSNLVFGMGETERQRKKDVDIVKVVSRSYHSTLIKCGFRNSHGDTQVNSDDRPLYTLHVEVIHNINLIIIM